MQRRNGPWTITGQRQVYDNPWISLTHHDVVHPTGAPGQCGVVHYKNRAIGVLPLLDDGRVPLVGQHRFPFDMTTWELPEGGGPLDADPLQAAERELAEETGYRATGWARILDCQLSNSVSDEVAIGFVAWDMTPGTAAPEDSEELSLAYISFAELHERVLSGDIVDSLTILIVLKAAALALRGGRDDTMAVLLPEKPAAIIRRSLGR
jgi:8-oxo-dGTP pyrophosphatase MutT (NUDIX family)